MKKRSPVTTKTLCLLFACMFTGILEYSGNAALITNGSLEDAGGSFNGWTVAGTAVVTANQFGAPTDGAAQAFVSNSAGSVTSAALSAFFGGATLPGNARGVATEGSAIKQTFTSTGAVQYSFDYRYVTQEGIGSGYDEGFYFVDGAVFSLANSTSAGLIAIDRYTNGTPYRSVSLTLSAGLHTIGFGTYDTGDASGDSALIVDNIQAVPEPATFGVGLGLAFAGLFFRRTRRARG
jgi:PEP-CTERM motif